jgi:hypothetical protein
MMPRSHDVPTIPALPPAHDAGDEAPTQIVEAPRFTRDEADRPDRRREDRRGTKIQIFRFTNDRRLGDDRRGRPRRGFDRLPLPVTCGMRHQGIRYTLTAADVSVLGVRLLGAPPLPHGALVRLNLELPDDLAEFPLSTWAQVVSFCTERSLIGLRFVGLRACDARRLGRLLARGHRGQREGNDTPYRF